MKLKVVILKKSTKLTLSAKLTKEIKKSQITKINNKRGAITTALSETRIIRIL